MINRYGVGEAVRLAGRLTEAWDLAMPRTLAAQAAAGKPFAFELIKTGIKDGVATLTINRPDAMNALNEAVVGQLHDAFRTVAADPDVRGIVIGGAGKAFIAGADIRFFVRNIDAGDLDRIVAFTRDGHELLGEIAGCSKPVIARLHGLALGGGLELALACHRIVATPKTTVAFPETGIGIYPGLGGTQRTPRRVGGPLAKWLIYTGRMIGAAEAEAIGLVDAVVPHATLDGAIEAMIATGLPEKKKVEAGPKFADLARLFGENSAANLAGGKVDTADNEGLAKAIKPVRFKAPLALALAEKLIDGGSSVSLEQGLQMELDHLVEIFSSADAYEGLSSLGRRRPAFKGS